MTSIGSSPCCCQLLLVEGVEFQPPKSLNSPLTPDTYCVPFLLIGNTLNPFLGDFPPGVAKCHGPIEDELVTFRVLIHTEVTLSFEL